MSGAEPTAILADIAELNPPLAASLSDGDEVSFMPMAAVDADSATAVDRETRSYSEVGKGYTPFVDGDVLVAKITPCFENGKIAQARLSRRYGFGSTEFHVVRPRDDRADARYLVHFLRQERIRKEGESRMTGTAGQRRVPEHFLAGLTIPLPPLPEQRRIAAILDNTDALRAQRGATLAKLDTLTQSIFLDMFGDPATNPKGWLLCRVSEYVAEFQGGKSLESESGENAVTRNRVLKVSAVTGMTFLAHECKPVPDSYTPPVEHFVRPGDLLFSRANTTDLVGAIAYVEHTPQNLLLPDKLWRFVWRKPALVEPLFVWALFQTPALRREIGRRATGTSGSMKNISQEKVFSISTICPPIAIQKEFTGRLAAVERVRIDCDVSAKDSEALFTSLQYRAFRGEL